MLLSSPLLHTTEDLRNRRKNTQSRRKKQPETDAHTASLRCESPFPPARWSRRRPRVFLLHSGQDFVSFGPLIAHARRAQDVAAGEKRRPGEETHMELSHILANAVELEKRMARLYTHAQESASDAKVGRVLRLMSQESQIHAQRLASKRGRRSWRAGTFPCQCIPDFV